MGCRGCQMETGLPNFLMALGLSCDREMAAAKRYHRTADCDGRRCSGYHLKMRDEFALPTREALAKRVGLRCSNPGCRQLTSGPQEDPTKAINIGVAAHITAASEDGPRYDSTITVDARKSAPNGIWLCQVCAKLVDNDPDRYTVDILHRWKTISEAAALRELENRGAPGDGELLFLRLEQLMPDLLNEIRADLKERPLTREFVLLKKVWSYWAGGQEASYFYEDHADLDSKIRILQNYGLIREITHTNVKRYVFTEGFARYFGV